MDAQQWHEACLKAGPVEPAPLTAAHWARMSDEQREAHHDAFVAWLAASFVHTDHLDDVTRTVSKVLQYNASTPMGAKLLPTVSGPNFVGKSRLMTRWAQQLYADWTRGAEQDDRGRPVIRSPQGYEADFDPLLWVDLPAAANIKDVDTAILKCLNLPSTGLKRDLTTAVVAAVRRHGVRAVVFDDVHLLKTELKTGRDVLDHVKHLNTEFGQANISLVLVGANLEGGALVTDPQLASRCRLQHLGPQRKDEVADMRVWQHVVRQLEQLVLPHLPKGSPEMLFTRLAGQLFDRTQGYLGYLVELITAATLAAIDDGSFKITAKQLDAVDLGGHVAELRRQAAAGQRASRRRAPAAHASSRESTRQHQRSEGVLG
jgi:hypothetical protein